jgi:hypothetical protein
MNVYVVIDLERLGKVTDTPSTYGSLKELVSANIEDKGKILTYSGLWERLSKNSDVHYWRSERYIIKQCEVQRSKQKNPKK